MSPPSIVPGAFIDSICPYPAGVPGAVIDSVGPYPARTRAIASSSPLLVGAPGLDMTFTLLLTTAVSSTKQPSGYLSSASSTVSSTPHLISASQYAACCSRAWLKSGRPRPDVVIPLAKFLPGLLTIALVYILLQN